MSGDPLCYCSSDPETVQIAKPGESDIDLKGDSKLSTQLFPDFVKFEAKILGTAVYVKDCQLGFYIGEESRINWLIFDQGYHDYCCYGPVIIEAMNQSEDGPPIESKWIIKDIKEYALKHDAFRARDGPFSHCAYEMNLPQGPCYLQVTFSFIFHATVTSTKESNMFINYKFPKFARTWQSVSDVDAEIDLNWKESFPGAKCKELTMKKYHSHDRTNNTIKVSKTCEEEEDAEEEFEISVGLPVSKEAFSHGFCNAEYGFLPVIYGSTEQVREANNREVWFCIDQSAATNPEFGINPRRSMAEAIRKVWENMDQKFRCSNCRLIKFQLSRDRVLMYEEVLGEEVSGVLHKLINRNEKPDTSWYSGTASMVRKLAEHEQEIPRIVVILTTLYDQEQNDLVSATADFKKKRANDELRIVAVGSRRVSTFSPDIAIAEQMPIGVSRVSNELYGLIMSSHKQIRESVMISANAKNIENIPQKISNLPPNHLAHFYFKFSNGHVASEVSLEGGEKYTLHEAPDFPFDVFWCWQQLSNIEDSMTRDGTPNDAMDDIRRLGLLTRLNDYNLSKDSDGKWTMNCSLPAEDDRIRHTYGRTRAMDDFTIKLRSLCRAQKPDRSWDAIPDELQANVPEQLRSEDSTKRALYLLINHGSLFVQEIRKAIDRGIAFLEKNEGAEKDWESEIKSWTLLSK